MMEKWLFRLKSVILQFFILENLFSLTLSIGPGVTVLDMMSVLFF